MMRQNAQRGAMLVELLLSMALAMLIIPFVFQYQGRMAQRARDVALTQQIDTVRVALERYITANRTRLLAPVGRNITRVQLSDLADFGLASDLIENAGDTIQLRVLKSGDTGGQATLQGVVVYADADISPLRTRQIVNLGGDQMGFVENNRAYGAYGTWRADALDLGVRGMDAIVDTTDILRGDKKYLWRVPSDNAADATMMAALNLAGHDVKNTAFFDADNAEFTEILGADAMAVGNLTFQNRTTVDKQFYATSAVVSGAMSADGRSMEVSGTLTLNDTGKFSSFTVGDLWVTNLTLSGLSIRSDVDAAVLKINQNLDMTAGRIDAIFASVGFTGSITPRLQVKNRIEDSIDPTFYWSVSGSAADARLMDLSLNQLNDMAIKIAASRDGTGTTAARLFGPVARNRNATAADFMNVIHEISARVRAKYRLLNLE
ncbi:hypothetical protein HDR63_01665 [bacterium]|nr:hypothetical protein [bacterium]